MRMMLVVLLSLLTIAVVAPAYGVTLRYALIIGNNVGVDTDGSQPFPPLLHAEREAKLLRQRLVGLSNFDASSARTRLLTGATVQEVEAAFQALARQKQRDQQHFGEVDSIFLLYFTGHGLAGRLLLRDAPISSAALGGLFNSVGADFSVGVFDACYAGSLDGVLSEKGIRATPGLNIIRDLPSEVLSAHGSVWYVSSGSGQPSYEDDKLGGVFTHFFIEALEKAEKDGPGITLDSIWRYVREHTTTYTAARRRAQVPEQLIARLRSKSPVYFSFPVPRSATLVLSEKLEGEFALAYADGYLTEVFHKEVGQRRELAVYPGSARLILLSARQSPRPEHAFTLAHKGTLILQTMPESVPNPAVGERTTPLLTKGAGVEKRIMVHKIDPGISLLAGVGYGFSYSADEMLHPRHHLSIPIRLDRGGVVAGLAVTYGIDGREYPAWQYTAHMVGGDLNGGYGWDLGLARLSAQLGFAFHHIWQSFDGEEKTSGWQFHPRARASVLLPRTRSVAVEISVDIGPLYAPGSGLDAESSWNLAGGVAASFFYRVL